MPILRLRSDQERALVAWVVLRYHPALQGPLCASGDGPERATRSASIASSAQRPRARSSASRRAGVGLALAGSAAHAAGRFPVALFSWSSLSKSARTRRLKAVSPTRYPDTLVRPLAPVQPVFRLCNLACYTGRLWTLRAFAHTRRWSRLRLRRADLALQPAQITARADLARPAGWVLARGPGSDRIVDAHPRHCWAVLGVRHCVLLLTCT